MLFQLGIDVRVATKTIKIVKSYYKINACKSYILIDLDVEKLYDYGSTQ